MPITTLESGALVASGTHGVAIYRLLSMKSAMSLKLKCGMEMTRSVRIFPLVKREFGLKGSNQKVYDQFCAMLPGLIEAHKAAERDESEQP